MLFDTSYVIINVTIYLIRKLLGIIEKLTAKDYGLVNRPTRIVKRVL